MENYIEFSILKIEGLEFEQVHIWEEGYPETTLRPHNLKQHIKLIGDKEITIEVQGPKEHGRISFFTSALPNEGLQYLPLDSDLVLDSILEDVSIPRLLICIINKLEFKDESPNIKLFEKDSSKDHKYEGLDLEHILNKKEQEYQTEIIDLKSLSYTQKGQQEFEMEKLIMQVKRQRVLLDEYEDNVKAFKDMLDKERSLRENQDLRLIAMSQQYQNSLQRAQQSEEELLKIVNDKEKELRMAVQELSELRSENQTLLWQRNRVSEDASRLEIELATVSLSEFKEEVLFLKEELTRSEDQRHELAIKLKELENEWNSSISTSTGNSRDFIYEIEELKEKVSKREQEYETLKRDYEDLLCCLETTSGDTKPVEEVYLQYKQVNTYSEELEQKLRSSESEIQYLTQQTDIYKRKVKEEILHSHKIEDSFNAEKQINLTLKAQIETLSTSYHDVELLNLQEKQKREVMQCQLTKEKSSNEKVKELLEALRKEKDHIELTLNQERAKTKAVENNLSSEKARYTRLKQLLEDERKCKDYAGSKSDRSMDLDKRVQAVLKKEGYEGILIKIGDGLYQHNRQRLKLSLENGGVICRYANKSVTLEEYLMENAHVIVENSRKSLNTTRNTTPPKTPRRMKTLNGLSPDDIREKIQLSLLEDSGIFSKERLSINPTVEEAKINEPSLSPRKREKVCHPVLRNNKKNSQT